MKRIIIFLLIFFPSIVFALDYPELHYKNAIVYDLTDKKVLYELNSNEVVSIASLTKLMTIITAIENIEDPTEKIVYTSEMANNVAYYASIAGFVVGQTYTFEDLLYGAMLPSGADATVALAIHTSKDIDSFVKEMNELAQKIGMKNSHFVNVHGLDEKEHYSSANDIKILLEYSLKNQLFKKVYTTKKYTLSTGKELKSTVLKQSEKYQLDLSKVIGSKTGFTAKAGLCISALMEHKNHEIIFITLRASTKNSIPYNMLDTIELINFIEKNYDNQTVLSKGDLIKKIKVEHSKISDYKIYSNIDVNLFLPNDYDKTKLVIKYDGVDNLSYKNNKNEKIGEITYLYDNQIITKEDIYLKEEIKIDYLKIIKSKKDIIIIWGLGILSTILLIIYIKKAISK